MKDAVACFVIAGDNAVVSAILWVLTRWWFFSWGRCKLWYEELFCTCLNRGLRRGRAAATSKLFRLFRVSNVARLSSYSILRSSSVMEDCQCCGQECRRSLPSRRSDRDHLQGDVWVKSCLHISLLPPSTGHELALYEGLVD